MKTLLIILSLLIGYLLGSINPAIIYSRLKGRDIRTLGSKNAGATNTLRNFGKGAALIVTLSDILKCVAAILAASLLARLFAEDELVSKIFAATGCILGHNFPVYFGFKGGKGVLVSVTALFMIDWRIGAAALGIFIVVFMIWRYVSLGSITGAIAAMAASLITKDVYVTAFTAFAALLTIIRHRSNILRLIEGTESKTTFHSHKE